MPDSTNAIDICSTANYFHRFNFDGNEALFLLVNEDTFEESAFLDDRINSVLNTHSSAALPDCIQKVSQKPLPRNTRFIFHTAYCCSTLLSRALHIKDRTVAYREPVPLHQLAVMIRRSGSFTPVHVNNLDQYLSFSLHMLSKTWNDEEVSIVKPTDSCNNIIGLIYRVAPETNSLLLYSKLKDFIASNLKSEGRRRFLNDGISSSLLFAQVL